MPLCAAVQLAVGSADASDTQVKLVVDPAIAVAPGLTRGDTAVRLPDFTGPGQEGVVTSKGWKIAANCSRSSCDDNTADGYKLSIRASSAPALSGNNAADSVGARGSFQDFPSGATPDTWDSVKLSRGTFGYSISGSPQFVDPSTWGGTGSALRVMSSATSDRLKWKGLSTSDVTVAQTNDRPTSEFSLHFRAEIPDGSAQPAGAYRAVVILTITPDL